MHWEPDRLPIFGQIVMLPLFPWTLHSRCVEHLVLFILDVAGTSDTEAYYRCGLHRASRNQRYLRQQACVMFSANRFLVRYSHRAHSCPTQHLIRLQLQTWTSSEKAAAAQADLRCIALHNHIFAQIGYTRLQALGVSTSSSPPDSFLCGPNLGPLLLLDC